MRITRPFYGPVNDALDRFVTKTLNMAGGVAEKGEDLTYWIDSDDDHAAGVAEGSLSVLPALFGGIVMVLLLIVTDYTPTGPLLDVGALLLVALVTVEALEQGRDISVKTYHDDDG